MKPIEVVSIGDYSFIINAGYGSNLVSQCYNGQLRDGPSWARINDQYRYVLKGAINNFLPYSVAHIGYEIDATMLNNGELYSEYMDAVFNPFINGEGTKETLMLPEEFVKLRRL